MKDQMKYFILGFLIILLSAPMGYEILNTYYNRNLFGEYTTMLNGFIHSFMAIGILIVFIGLVEALINKK